MHISIYFRVNTDTDTDTDTDVYRDIDTQKGKDSYTYSRTCTNKRANMCLRG